MLLATKIGTDTPKLKKVSREEFIEVYRREKLTIVCLYTVNIFEQGVCRPFPRFVKLHPSISDTILTPKDLNILNHSSQVQPSRKSNSSLSKFLETSGRKIVRTVPDGNCFFRALSINLHGHQEEHLAIRKLITNFEKLNMQKFGTYLTPSQSEETTIADHIVNMAKPCAWATQVELLAATSYFQVPVYSCHKSNDKYTWNVFKPIRTSEDLNFPADGSYPAPALHHFEIVYHTETHYDSILNITSNRVSRNPPTVVGPTIYIELD